MRVNFSFKSDLTGVILVSICVFAGGTGLIYYFADPQNFVAAFSAYATFLAAGVALFVAVWTEFRRERAAEADRRLRAEVVAVEMLPHATRMLDSISLLCKKLEAEKTSTSEEKQLFIRDFNLHDSDVSALSARSRDFHLLGAIAGPQATRVWSWMRKLDEVKIKCHFEAEAGRWNVSIRQQFAGDMIEILNGLGESLVPLVAALRESLILHTGRPKP